MLWPKVLPVYVKETHGDVDTQNDLSAETGEHYVTALMSEPGIKEKERGGGQRESDREIISQPAGGDGTFGAGSFTLVLRMSGISPYESVCGCVCVHLRESRIKPVLPEMKREMSYIT